MTQGLKYGYVTTDFESDAENSLNVLNTSSTPSLKRKREDLNDNVTFNKKQKIETTCRHCDDLNFGNNSNLLEHFKREHLNSCPYCNECLIEAKDLVSHIINDHLIKIMLKNCTNALLDTHSFDANERNDLSFGPFNLENTKNSTMKSNISSKNDSTETSISTSFNINPALGMVQNIIITPGHKDNAGDTLHLINVRIRSC